MNTTIAFQKEYIDSSSHIQNSMQSTPQIVDYAQESRVVENGNCRHPPFDYGQYVQHGDEESYKQSMDYKNVLIKEDFQTNFATKEKNRQCHMDMNINDCSMYNMYGNCDYKEDRIQVVLPTHCKVIGREDSKNEQCNTFEDASNSIDELNSKQLNDPLLAPPIHLKVNGEVDTLQFNHEGHINAILEVNISIIINYYFLMMIMYNKMNCT